MFFKKKSVEHPFFGKLTYTGNQWEGTKLFPPESREIYLYLDSDDKEVSAEYESLWNSLCTEYGSILKITVEKVIKYCQEIVPSDVGIPQKLKKNNLSLEGINFEKNLTVRIYWGLIINEGEEAELEIVTSLKNGKVEVLGVGD